MICDIARFFLAIPVLNSQCRYSQKQQEKEAERLRKEADEEKASGEQTCSLRSFRNRTCGVFNQNWGVFGSLMQEKVLVEVVQQLSPLTANLRVSRTFATATRKGSLGELECSCPRAAGVMT